MEFKEITEDMVVEQRSLVLSGDTNLEKEYKEPYRRLFGRNTTLTDDQLLYVAASEDDDMSPEERAEQMYRYEVFLQSGVDTGESNDADEAAA